MRMSFKSLLAFASFAIVPHSGFSQEEMRFSFSGESLSPEQRQVIINALDPTSDIALLSAARLNPRAPENILDDDTLEELDALLKNSRSGGIEGDNFFFATDQNGQAFAVVDRWSDLAQRLGIPTLQPTSRYLADGTVIFSDDSSLFQNAPVASPEASQAWALPLDNEDVLQLGIPIRPPSMTSPTLSTEFVEVERSDLDDVLARVEEDLRGFGSASVNIPINASVATASDEIVAAFTSAGAVFSETAKSLDVTQDLPEEFELLSLGNSQCTTNDHWPMSHDEFETVMKRNKQVLALAGVHAPARARILVVDSGLPAKLAQIPDFNQFLRPDRTRALRRGYYWTGLTSQEGNVTCDLGVNGHRGGSAFGIVTSPMSNECSALDLFGSLQPVKTSALPPRYEPNHGGIVGVLAAGGPTLIRSELDLHQHIGIGFARINSVEAGRIRARDEDVAEAIQFAIDENYNVVNMSLAFKYDSNSAAKTWLGCFVTTGASGRCAVRDDRIIVAAAGNDSQRMTSSASSFPYEIASTVKHEFSGQVLIVGGIAQDEAGNNIPWKSSTYHEQLVDILAPSVGVVSLGGKGEPVCVKGTSVAAPQVSFVAGMLFSLGYTRAAEVRERILATAKMSKPGDELFDRARNGSVLDPVAALDVFSDLIWIFDSNGNEVSKRGRLVAPGENLKGVVLPVCTSSSAGLQGFGGLRDVSRFSLWRSLEDNLAEVWDPEFSAVADRKCFFDPDETIHFVEHDGDNTVEEFPLKNVARIVPSHFRRALQMEAEDY